MQEDLRIFDHDDSSVLAVFFHIGFQQGQQVYALASGSHHGQRPFHFPVSLIDNRIKIQHTVDIQIHLVPDLIAYHAVFLQIFVDTVGEFIEIHLIHPVFHQLCSLKYGQLRTCFFLYLRNTLETFITGLVVLIRTFLLF